MLKNILNLDGVQQLDKNKQRGIQGGQFCAIHCLSECYTGTTNQADIDACTKECKRLEAIHNNTVGGGFGF